MHVSRTRTLQRRKCTSDDCGRRLNQSSKYISATNSWISAYLRTKFSTTRSAQCERHPTSLVQVSHKHRDTSELEPWEHSVVQSPNLTSNTWMVMQSALILFCIGLICSCPAAMSTSEYEIPYDRQPIPPSRKHGARCVQLLSTPQESKFRTAQV